MTTADALFIIPAPPSAHPVMFYEVTQYITEILFNRLPIFLRMAEVSTRSTIPPIKQTLDIILNVGTQLVKKWCFQAPPHNSRDDLLQFVMEHARRAGYYYEKTSQARYAWCFFVGTMFEDLMNDTYTFHIRHDIEGEMDLGFAEKCWEHNSKEHVFRVLKARWEKKKAVPNGVIEDYAFSSTMTQHEPVEEWMTWLNWEQNSLIGA